MTKKKFTPMKVYTDKVAFRQAEQRAEQKINILNDAFNWCKDYIDTDEIDRGKFKYDFMAEFERLFIKKNKGKLSPSNQLEAYLELIFLE